MEMERVVVMVMDRSAYLRDQHLSLDQILHVHCCILVRLVNNNLEVRMGMGMEVGVEMETGMGIGMGMWMWMGMGMAWG